MNYKLLSLLFLFVLLFNSCKKLNSLTQFNLSFTETIIIPASTGINLPFNILTPDIQSNSEASFEIHDTRKDLIESIKMIQMNLVLKSPSSENFNFLKSIELFMDADGLNEVKIASKLNMSNDNVQTVTLDVTNSELKEYIKKDKFSLRVATTTDEAISQDYTIEINYVLFVDAKLKK
jgi:hypothetical protein